MSQTERQLMHDAGLSAEQIGFRRQVQESFRGLAQQEYAEDATACFLASGTCIFDTASIDARLKELTAPSALGSNGNLQVWLTPVPGRQYLVSVDPAGGGAEGDPTAMQVVDLAIGVQCAELRGKLSPLEAAIEAASLARRYNGALLVVERNNHGAGVLAYLESVCRYERIYRSGGQNGWLTSAVTRPQILGRLGSALVETPTLFCSERLLKECRSFVRHASGRTEAQAGEHDDCVMAMAIALAVRGERLAGGAVQ